MFLSIRSRNESKYLPEPVVLLQVKQSEYLVLRLVKLLFESQKLTYFYTINADMTLFVFRKESKKRHKTVYSFCLQIDR